MKKVNADFKSVIFMFLILFISDDSLLLGTNSEPLTVIVKFGFFISLTLFGIAHIWNRKLKIDRDTFMIFIILSMLIFLSAIINVDIRFGYLYRIWILLLGVIYTKVLSYEKIIVSFVSVMQFIASYSIVVYVIEIFRKNLLTYFPTIINSANNTFYNLFFTVVPHQNWGVPRNYGFFREPGVYIIFLLLALAFRIFIIGSPKIWNQIILVVAVLTTRSTTGYIALVILYVLYIFSDTKKVKDLVVKFTILLTSISLLYYLTNYTDIIYSDNPYMGVLNKFDTLENSVARISSITINLELFLKNPITGLGISKVLELFPNLVLLRYGIYTEHNTNTTLIQFSMYGVIFGIIFAMLLFKSMRKNTDWYSALSIFIILQILFIGENISNNLFLSILLFLWSSKVDTGENQKFVV